MSSFLAYRYAFGAGDGQRPVGGQKYLTSSRIARVLFCVAEGQMILLHGFIKKSQKTPGPDLELALKRTRGHSR